MKYSIRLLASIASLSVATSLSAAVVDSSQSGLIEISTIETSSEVSITTTFELPDLETTDCSATANESSTDGGSISVYVSCNFESTKGEEISLLQGLQTLYDSLELIFNASKDDGFYDLINVITLSFEYNSEDLEVSFEELEETNISSSVLSELTAVPLPAAVWLMGSALLSLLGARTLPRA